MTWMPKPVDIKPLDVTCDFDAYFVGLLQTDGHVSVTSRNRSRIEIELKYSDAPLLIAVANLLPYKSSLRRRQRTTNFGANDSMTLSIHNRTLQQQLERLGVPPGRKSDRIAPPSVPFDELAYWRGIIDGDGSLGVTGNGYPFVSLVTSSDALAEAYARFCGGITGRQPRPNRNARDRVYNICAFKEAAVAIAGALYLRLGVTIALARKAEAARRIASWRRQTGMRRIENQRPWDPESDEIVLTYPKSAAAALLGRTLSSIANRRFRLRSGR